MKDNKLLVSVVAGILAAVNQAGWATVRAGYARPAAASVVSGFSLVIDWIAWNAASGVLQEREMPKPEPAV